MKILCANQVSLEFDELNNRVRMGKKTVEIPGNVIMQSGDIVKIDGRSYVLLDFSIPLFSSIAHRGAQIIDAKDASYMVTSGNIKYGSRVLESGTGSGALTVAILKVVGDPGFYTGVDHSDESARITKNNVRNLSGMDVHINVEEFENFDPEGKRFDAIFLDLPEPWKNVERQKTWISPGSRIVTYLPTTNQLEKTVYEYTESGFYHLESVELSMRQMQVKKDAVRPVSSGIIHTGYISTFVKLSGSVLNISNS